MWIKLAYIFEHHVSKGQISKRCFKNKLAHMDGKVSPDGSRERSGRVGLA